MPPPPQKNKLKSLPPFKSLPENHVSSPMKQNEDPNTIQVSPNMRQNEVPSPSTDAKMLNTEEAPTLEKDSQERSNAQSQKSTELMNPVDNTGS